MRSVYLVVPPSMQAKFTETELEAPDVHTASDEYANRFAGPMGAWLLSFQERAVLRLLQGLSAPSILDVGGGHGQIALPLLNHGYSVTVLGSSIAALQQLAAHSEPQLTKHVGNLLALPYAPKSFDVVVCFRLLAHCEQWSELITELCRVARKMVIVDYPTCESVNVFSSTLFSLKKNVEKNTRPFILFRNRQIATAFAAQQFQLAGKTKQFFWPMVLHRMIKAPAVSQLLESVPHALGLTAVLGSPVVAAFVPKT